MNKANSIGISDDYKNKVINGTLSVEDIDTSTDTGKQLAKDVKISRPIIIQRKIVKIQSKS